MERPEPEVLALAVAVASQEPHDLRLPRHVADLLQRARRRARRLPFRRLAIQSAGLNEGTDRLHEAPLARLQVHVRADARGAIARKPERLTLRGRVLRIEALAREHLFAVQGPALHEDVVAVLPPDLVRQMIRDRDLEEVARDALVAEDGPWILDGCADVEVAALRVVGGDEEEPLRVLVVEPGRVHEAAR